MSFPDTQSDRTAKRSAFCDKKKTKTKTEKKTRTCPYVFTPALQTLPQLPTNSVWFLPHAACTIFVPSTAPKSCTALIRLGAFSEMASTPVLELLGPGTPKHEAPFRPKSHAWPSASMHTKWHPLHEVWTEVVLTLRRERRRWGSRRSGQRSWPESDSAALAPRSLRPSFGLASSVAKLGHQGRTSHQSVPPAIKTGTGASEWEERVGGDSHLSPRRAE